MCKISSFSKIKKGEFFRFPQKSKVYCFDGGGPKRGFNYYAADDINNFQSTKTDRKIEIDFEY